jgi:hypothetical protein
MSSEAVDRSDQKSVGDPNNADLGPVETAQELLVGYKTGSDPEPSLNRLAAFDDDDLRPVRTDRETALAFWINLYNAGTQRLLEESAELYESSLRFFRFFRAPCVTVGGTQLSLDDIEQGILRGYSKYGLGYVPRLFAGSFEKRYRLDELDTRVHFALNCGAESCPAIRAYDPDTIDDQLDLATSVYLDSTVEYNPDAGTVKVPRVFLWYRGDFGGKSGTADLLRNHEIIPSDAEPSVSYKSWDWTRTEGKFVE